MNPLVFLALAFAPGAFWLWFFARKDRYQPAPRRLLMLTFALGMAATIPAALLESLWIDESLVRGEASIMGSAAAMLLIVGPVEEGAKFAAVRLGPYRSLYFDEPMDGLVFSAAASLGFASLENLVYMINYGAAVILVRAPLSTVAHAVFGSVWGYALGLGHERTGGSVLVVGGLGLAAVAHGLFNLSVIANPLLAVMMVVAGVAWTLSRFGWAQRVSPFRYRRNYPRVQCRSCQRLVRVTSRYCHFCGAGSMDQARVLFCGHCGSRNRPDAAYCTWCGDRLLS